MVKRRRTAGLSRLRQPFGSKTGSNSWSLWMVGAAFVAMVAFAVGRSFIAQDDWLQWTHVLEVQAAGFTWPSWNPDWPPLPPSPVQHADFSGPYAFAATHREELRYIPCFCGCGRLGHRSNADCYLRSMSADGRPEWDDHSFTCTTCVDVTREVALMMKMGRPLGEIRREIEAHHTGNATATPEVPADH